MEIIKKLSNTDVKSLGFFDNFSASATSAVFLAELRQINLALVLRKVQCFELPPHGRHYPVQVVLLGVHQLRHDLPLVPPGVVLVGVHRRLLLCSLLSTVSRPHGLVLVKVVVLELVKVCLRHTACCLRSWWEL